MEAYDDLTLSYTLQNSCTFLSRCYLLEEGSKLQSCQLSRMIYTLGNQHEIYTRNERNYIDGFLQEVGTYSYTKQAHGRAIPCRIASVNFSDAVDPLYECIKFMKIFNKAFDGLNIFLFVISDGIHFGSSNIWADDSDGGCIISPCLTKSSNWSVIYSNFLYRDDSEDFFKYYFGVMALIYSFRDSLCWAAEDQEILYPSCYPGDTEDYIDRISHAIVHKGHNSYPDFSDFDAKSEDAVNNFDLERFDADVLCCKYDLSYIKTNRVNPLEMLFAAETAFTESQLTEKELERQTNSSDNSSLTDNDRRNFELLSDPIALMKKLKQDRRF